MTAETLRRKTEAKIFRLNVKRLRDLNKTIKSHAERGEYEYFCPNDRFLDVKTGDPSTSMTASIIHEAYGDAGFDIYETAALPGYVCISWAPETATDEQEDEEDDAD